MKMKVSQRNPKSYVTLPFINSSRTCAAPAINVIHKFEYNRVLCVSNDVNTASHSHMRPRHHKCTSSSHLFPSMHHYSITGVAMEACEFWSALSDDNDAHVVLQSHLSTLIPALISRLQLKEEQILQVYIRQTIMSKKPFFSIASGCQLTFCISCCWMMNSYCILSYPVTFSSCSLILLHSRRESRRMLMPVERRKSTSSLSTEGTYDSPTLLTFPPFSAPLVSLCPFYPVHVADHIDAFLIKLSFLLSTNSYTAFLPPMTPLEVAKTIKSRRKKRKWCLPSGHCASKQR